MGDKTTVDLDVPALHKSVVSKFLIPFLFPTVNTTPMDHGVIRFTIDEVNYGDLPFLEELQKLGIAFHQYWESGSEYTAGERSLRFTEEGVAIHRSFFQSDIADQVEDALAKYDPQLSDQELGAQFRLLCESIKAQTETLPWDYQVEYGKLYRTRQLIDPS